jgi:hypothetical protein
MQDTGIMYEGRRIAARRGLAEYQSAIGAKTHPICTSLVHAWSAKIETFPCERRRPDFGRRVKLEAVRKLRSTLAALEPHGNYGNLIVRH